MSGIVNQTGAKSGVIGTTVGTPSSVAGTCVFWAYSTASSWAAVAADAKISFNAERYDPDNVYTIADSLFVAPATGVYFFGYHIYSANSTSNDNGWQFQVDATIPNRTVTDGEHFSFYQSSQGDTTDHMQVASTVIPLNISQEVGVYGSYGGGEIYQPHSHWWGYRIS